MYPSFQTSAAGGKLYAKTEMADPFLKRYPLGFAFYFLIPANAQRENFLLVHFYYNTLLLLGGFTTYSTPWLRVPVYETNITCLLYTSDAADE